eukprot:jgi/Mesen1/8410/ME000471S07727
MLTTHHPPRVLHSIAGSAACLAAAALAAVFMGLVMCQRFFVAPDPAAARCHSLRHNAGVGNIRNWTLPPECVPSVCAYVGDSARAQRERARSRTRVDHFSVPDARRYGSENSPVAETGVETGAGEGAGAGAGADSRTHGGVGASLYEVDFAGAVESARAFYEGLEGARWRSDLLVLDIDETSLLNLAYYRQHAYGAKPYDPTSWAAWVETARAPPAVPTLQLYRDLQAANWSVAFVTGRPESQRNASKSNLIRAGYSGWAALVMRQAPNNWQAAAPPAARARLAPGRCLGSPHEANETALVFKSRARERLEQSGYRILGGLGDQWSDLQGPHHGARTFKLPNPMYYIA